MSIDDVRQMRVLVTGATGFVGAHITAALAQAGATVIGLHHGASRLGQMRQELTSGDQALTLLQCEIRDERTVNDIFRTERPTHVVHTAAITPTLEEERHQARQIVETNELGALTVLEAAARNQVERFIYISSAAVYATTPIDQKITEDASVCDTCGIYAVTKLGGERLSRWATLRFGLDTRVLRLGPVYGQFERPTRSRANMSGVYKAVRLAEADEILRCNAPNAVRDWIHGDDVARAVSLLLATSDLRHATYNLAGPNVTMRRLLELVSDVVPQTQVEWVDTVVQANIPVSLDNSRGRLDTFLLEEDTGFKPTIDMEPGIRTCLSAASNDR